LDVWSHQVTARRGNDVSASRSGVPMSCPAEKWSPAPASTMTTTSSSSTARVKASSSAYVMAEFWALR
jgi:hypothetical protein